MALGILVIGILFLFMILFLIYGPYYWWKIRYNFFNLFDIFANRKREECDKEVLCINGNQLFYLKDIYNEQTGQFTSWWWKDLIISRQIWLSHGPRQQLAAALTKEFKDKIVVIHIGRLVQYSLQDREGLKSLNKEFQLKVWKEEANKVYPQYKTHLHSYLQQLEEEMEYPLNMQDNYSGREREVALIASGELGVTHLLTNEGKLYRSNNGLHAEIVFCEDTTVKAQNIRELWIKNSPCGRCSRALIRRFTYINKKPKLFIGSMYKLSDQENYKEMVKLSKEGFQLEIWKSFLEHNYNMRAEFTKTAKKLQKIKEQAQSYYM